MRLSPLCRTPRERAGRAGRAGRAVIAAGTALLISSALAAAAAIPAAATGGRDWIYTPVGSPQNSWRPTVTSVTANSNGFYHLTGTQLSGFVTTGEDDFQDPQGFPVVYLTNAAGNVYYPRSYNFSTMAPSTPGEVETADFTLPSSLPHGTYNLFVSACGISSATGYSFTY